MLLFLVFLVSFILRVMSRIENDEPVGAAGYGYLLVAAVGVFLALFVSLVVKQFAQHRRFQMGLEEFASGGFDGEEGVELGLLTRGITRDLHSDGAAGRGDDGDPASYTPLVGAHDSLSHPHTHTHSPSLPLSLSHTHTLSLFLLSPLSSLSAPEDPARRRQKSNKALAATV